MKYKLRNWEENDIDNLIKHANNKNIAMFLRDAFPHPYTKEDARIYINNCIKNKKNPRIIIKAIADDRDEAIGSIGIFMKDKDDVYRKCAEIGYWLSEDYWGKGIMTAAIADICKIAFNTTDLVRISAEIFEPNKASEKVLKKNGFKFEGKLRNSVYKNRKILDSLIYALTRDDKNKKEAQ